jgi:two-component system, cell cycle sensor histidine kinase and response regulator CckA
MTKQDSDNSFNIDEKDDSLEEKALILIVDDEPDILAMLSHIFTTHGYIVVTASTGEEGIRKVKEERPDLILLDVILPDLDGFEICRRIRSDSETKDTFIIILSARRTTVNNQVEGLQAGADGYMTKPVDPDELLARVNAMVRIKRAEDALKQSESLWRTMFEGANDIILLLDEDCRIRACNRKAIEAYGYTEAEMSNKNLYEICFEGERKKVEKEMAEARLRDGSVFETRHLRKDGTDFPVEVSSKPLLIGNRLTSIQAIRDITERKRAEERVLEQAALLNNAKDAILVRNLDGRIIFWNKGARRVYGWTAEEAIGEKANTLLYRKVSPRILEAYSFVIENGEWSGELNQVDRDGNEVIVESSWTLMRDDEGRPKSILIVNTNITEKKKLESQFLRAQRMESIGTLASGIAHDLNNILAPILLSIQLLKTKLPEERDQQLLTTLQTITQRGADLVKQVLSFARGVDGEQANIQPQKLINEVEKVLKEAFPKSIEIKIELYEDIWTINGDLTQLHQVLMNLCVNARDAMAQGGTLTISAKNFMIDENYARMNIDASPGPHVVITVADTGTGIAPDVIDKIFDPFFTTKEVGKGTGLGLSTVIGIVKNHGGFVNVYSEVGKGTQFKIYLPALRATTAEQAEEGRGKLPAGLKDLILVVDDEVSIREITRASLEAFDYRVLTAGDGVEAVALYAQHKNDISIVLLDMMMPIMDGPTTIRALQRINPKVKIIATSGLLPRNILDEATHISISSFLSKPYTAEELLHSIYRAIHSR